MRRILLAATILAFLIPGASAREGKPPPLSVDGEVVRGTYGVSNAQEIRAAAAAGFNLVIAGSEFLKPGSDTEVALRETGVRVMASLTSHIYGPPRLLTSVGPSDTDLLLSPGGHVPPGPGILCLDDEQIAYSEVRGMTLAGCQRGINGSRAAVHRAGTFLFFPEPVRREVKPLLASPLLWGYYVLDDMEGDQLSALRNMYRTLSEIDPGPGGKPRHPVGAGFGRSASLCNFSRDMCDFMILYPYPNRTPGPKHHRDFLLREVDLALAQARQIKAEIPFVGVLQAFGGGNWGTPTPAELRQQAEDYLRAGSQGIIVYGWNAGDLGGLSKMAGLRREMTQINRQIAQSHLRPSPLPPEFRKVRLGGNDFGPPPPGAHLPVRLDQAGIADSQQRQAWISAMKAGDPKRAAESLGFITEWLLVGPFESKSLLEPLPPEQTADWSRAFETILGPMRPFPYPSNGPFGEVWLNQPSLGSRDVAYYAAVDLEVVQDTPQTVWLWIATHGRTAVWLGGERVLLSNVGRAWRLYAMDRFRISLPPGRTRLVIKADNGNGAWGIAARMTDIFGQPTPAARAVLPELQHGRP